MGARASSRSHSSDWFKFYWFKCYKPQQINSLPLKEEGTLIKNRIFRNQEIRPLLSLLFVLLSLFSAAFFKITLRQLSYKVYREHKQLEEAEDKYYSSLKTYGKLTQTGRLEALAKKHSLNRKKRGQILQVIDGKALIAD